VTRINRRRLLQLAGLGAAGAALPDRAFAGARRGANEAAAEASDRTVRLWDVATGRCLRVFKGHTDEVFTAVFHPDGTRIAFNAGTGGIPNFYTRSLSELESKRVEAVVNGAAAFFSPDGRWVVYFSNESGKYEVYVVPFPEISGKWQISTSGGTYARWSHNGAELFYVAPDNKLMAAAVNGKGASFETGAVKPLFEVQAARATFSYDVSADGQRFLINTAPDHTESAPITVVLNWAAGLKK